MNDSTTLLIVDDDRDDFLLTAELLAEIGEGQYTLRWIDNYEDGLASLFVDPPELCLLDYFLGARTGLEFLREARRRGNATPIVLLTGQSDHGLDIEAMRAGAEDYLVKGEFGSRQLERSIRYAIERARSTATLKELNVQLLDARSRAQAVDAVRQQNSELDRLTTELAAGNARLHERERENQALIVRLQEAVAQLSTPLLRVWHDVIALPIVGKLDAERANAITSRTLQEIAAQRVRHLALDLTGVDEVDTQTLGHLMALARATRLLGVHCVLCGLRPAVARAIVELGVSAHGVDCVRDLHEALALVVAGRPIRG